MKITMNKYSLGYKTPELNVVDVRAECGFERSSMLDDMHETEGDWY